MKVAVASDDGVTVAPHFGHARCFLVFEVQGNEIRQESVRLRAASAHGGCGCGGGCGHGHSHPERPQGHAGIAADLGGCTAILCGGMGPHAAELLERAGITPLVVHGEGSARDAVEHYASGTLRTGQASCRCHD